MRVREAVKADAAAFVALQQRIYAETPFMLFEPGEWQVTVTEQEKRIEQAARAASGVIFLAEDDGQLVGAASGSRAPARRRWHLLYLVLGVLQNWSGRGVGYELLSTVECWGRANGVTRLELTVRADNDRAIRLYERFGFEREGVKRNSVYADGLYVDELYMGKLLPP